MENGPANSEFAFSNQSASYEGMKKEQSRLGSRAARWIVGGTIGVGCFAVLIAFVLFGVFRVSPIGEGLGEQLVVTKTPPEVIYWHQHATFENRGVQLFCRNTLAIKRLHLQFACNDSPGIRGHTPRLAGGEPP